MKHAFKQILVPTDFSAGSRLAINFAVGLAGRLRASVHLLHVIEDPPVAALFTLPYPDLESIKRKQRTDARHLMNALRGALNRRGITDEITEGSVAPTIAGVAADRGADFIVMGTHGRTGLSHVLVGSVAEQVLRIAGCPVLTVREGLAGSEGFAEALSRGAHDRSQKISRSGDDSSRTPGAGLLGL